MKSLKIVSVFIVSLFVFTIVSCEDEPLEGEFNIDNGQDDISCAQATQNLSTASANYGTTATDDENYAVVCNAYAVALQDMINACGDETGAIQTLLNALDCPTISDDCATAQSASDTAELAYNADTTNSTLCNAYMSALQNEIAQCGDADGSLQTIIDGLDCNDDTAPGDVLIRQIRTNYEDGTSFVEIFSYEGNNLTSILDSEGSETTYVYESGLLTRINWYETDGTLGDYVIPEYDADNRLISYIVYVTLGEEGLKFDLTYNTDGTITEMRYSGDHDSQTDLFYEGSFTMQNSQVVLEDDNNGFTATYSYDDKNGVFKNISNIETLNIINIDFSGYIPSGMNNLLEFSENDNGDVMNETFEYTYNASDYPVSSMDYLDGELDSTTEYIYD